MAFCGVQSMVTIFGEFWGILGNSMLTAVMSCLSRYLSCLAKDGGTDSSIFSETIISATENVFTFRGVLLPRKR